MKKYASLAAWIIVFETVSFLIGTATQGSVNGWYASLNPPPFTPPNLVFPVMWSILYALIAAAGWTVWRRRRSSAGQFLLLLFAIYMVLNWSWSFVFFGAHKLLIGFIWIILLNLVALLFIRRAWEKIRAAALLMIPPTIWTLYAAYLNGGYWWLNG